MQYLYCALIAAVIAAAVAVDTATVEVRKKAAVAACGRKFKETDRCYQYCVYTHFGILDSEGQYVKSVAVEFLWSVFPMLTQQQVTEVAKTCGSALDKSAADWERVNAVAYCFQDELKKIRLNSEGHYVRSVVVEFLWSLYSGLTQQQVTEGTTTCGSVLDKSAAGCQPGHTFEECLTAELKKVKLASLNTASHPAASWILQLLVIATVYWISVV